MNRLFSKYYFIFCILFFGSVSLAISQEKYTVSGYVKDVSSGESSIGASVYIKELLKGVNTNQYGFYSITVPKGSYHLVVSYIGFATVEKEIELNKDIHLNVDLGLAVVEAKTVEISSEKSNKNISNTSVGTVKLDIEEVKKLPAFMGEVDILKTIQLLPGVKSAGDGNTGFYVRGGGPDQNLILLDEAVVYNPSHLMGFVSVFNGDAVKSMSLVKGGMPAQYGGRLASVLDISMKEGNNKTFHTTGGIGLLSSRLTIEGPIKKDKSSFIISGRRSYADWTAKSALASQKYFGVKQDTSKSSQAASNTKLYFYDLNAKINYRLSDRDRLFLSGYFGRDILSLADPKAGFNFGISWGNATSVLRWNHLFSDKLFMNVSAIYSNYDYSVDINQSGFQLKLFSGIRDWNGKVDFAYFPSTRHEIRFGTNYVFHTFTPQSFSAKSGETVIDFGKVVKDKAHEAAVYLSDDFELTERIKIHAGLRYSYFMQVGPFDRYLKDPVNGQTSQIVHYRSNEKVKEYGGLEPRLNIRYVLNSKSSLKASYTYNIQYIHLASLSSVALPTDTWVPSSQLVRPQLGTQYSLGYFRNFMDNTWETSVELYYKEMKNQIEYKDGALPGVDLNDNSDNNFTFGKGWAYGSEFFVKKRVGKFNGWVGYTLSYTKRKFAALNYGKTYFAKYDRRNDASLVISYDANSRWTFSVVGVYGTGNALTVPKAYYFVDINFVTEYGARNDFRMPAYHRVDVSATWTPDYHKKAEHKKQRLIKKAIAEGRDISTIVFPKKSQPRFSSSWNFSIFNVYNRHNPYLVYFANEGNITTGDLKVKAKQISLFPILPSVTWNFKF
jgi:TonB dependent receptor/CarboxypepD_reg-like domain/TonB-dependent Receptor Plug Domain